MDVLGCDDPNALGCARSWRGVFGQVNHTRIGIREDSGLDNAGTSCSQLFRITVHEVGHALGLGHATSKPDQTVMNMPGDDLCGPQPYDAVAVMAVYQSR
ncbi:MAG: matrixin family metalloprotease [Acidimicrobiia bacterium]|nr:matrixin family metalloprotease [Acidimicrobiia bacterium]